MKSHFEKDGGTHVWANTLPIPDPAAAAVKKRNGKGFPRTTRQYILN